MKRFLTFLRIEATLGLRCPDGIIFGIGMPIGVMFLIAVIGGDNLAGTTNYTFMQSAFPSLLTVGICATAFMGIPLTIAEYRDKKILKHFFVTPASPMTILLAQVCVGILTSIVSAIAVAFVAVSFFQYQMEGNVLFFIGAYVLVMFSMYSIGMVIASICKTIKIANLVTTFVYFPMLFLSGATIPYELFPTFLQKVANMLPLTHGIKLLKAVSMQIYSGDLWLSVIMLLAFIVVGCILSVVLFKWE